MPRETQPILYGKEGKGRSIQAAVQLQRNDYHADAGVIDLHTSMRRKRSAAAPKRSSKWPLGVAKVGILAEYTCH